MAYNIHDIHPTSLALPGEAQQIEAVRTRLILETEEVRLGNDDHPGRTAARLAKVALYLANSGASPFEKLHTLNAAHANLLAGGTKRRNMRTVAGLSQQALVDTYPDTPDQATNELNRIEIAARRRAIQYTTPDTSFPLALEYAWEYFGHPIDPLIEATEEKILASIRANARERQLSTETGAIPFDDLLTAEEGNLVNTVLFSGSKK